MQTLHGIAVSPGVAIGEAFVVDSEGLQISVRRIAREAADSEIERLHSAIDQACQELEENRTTVSQELGEQYGAIFSAHLQLLRDPRLAAEIEEMVREQLYSAEYSVRATLRRYAKVFQKLQSSYLAERANDIYDIESRLLRKLLGQGFETRLKPTSPVIVVAHNLTPSETANLDRKYVRAFATEIGGPGGHTAIVAEAMEIPAVVGTGRFPAGISNGDSIIVDGDQGLLIIDPDENTIARYRLEEEEHHTLVSRLEGIRDLPAETLDGERVSLHANIEFPHEVEGALARGAEGIGLYRTEFLYLTMGHAPTEEEHHKAYALAADMMDQRPIVLRTLDLGADKIGGDMPAESGRNPFLGLRSIRLSLRNVPMFKTQLRAVLRASAVGNFRVMFPLVTTIGELRRAKQLLVEAMDELDEAGIPFNRDIPVGMMVEVPSVALLIDHFIDEVDFVSIGTNDLVQYTLAVDRSNKEVASLYNAADPSVLRLIDHVMRETDDTKVSVSMCGQMCGNPIYTMLLLGLGLRNLSLSPSGIPEIKEICRNVSIEHCREIKNQALTMESAQDVCTYLRDELRKAVPDWGAHG